MLVGLPQRGSGAEEAPTPVCAGRMFVRLVVRDAEAGPPVPQARVAPGKGSENGPRPACGMRWWAGCVPEGAPRPR